MSRIFHLLTLLVTTLVEWLIVDIPGPLGRRVRRLYWRQRLAHMGRDVQIDVGVQISRPEYVSIKDNVWIDNYVVILGGPPSLGEGPFRRRDNPDFMHAEGEIHIGSNVHIANYVVVQGHGGVVIGDNVGVASGSMIYSLSHHHSNLVDRSDPKKYKFTPMADRKDQSLISAAVVVGNDCAIGLKTVLLPGVSVGDGSWVASASVVAKTIPANALATGNPATVVKPELHPGWQSGT